MIATRDSEGWWQRLRAGWRQRQEGRQLARHAIPDRLWETTLARYPFLTRRPSEDIAALRRLSTLFLARKEFTAVGGLRLTDAMAVAVASQACLPVLRFGLDPYDDFVGIVLHPDAVVAQREWTDEIGVVHRGSETLTGEAMERGPVMLSWIDVARGGRSARWGYNVVVHEFAHVFDLHHRLTRQPTGGVATGWRDRLEDEYLQFRQTLAAGEETLLDPYGGESVAEFFAVSAEAFFVRSEALAETHAGLYELLKSCFRQDPAAAARTKAR